MTLEAIKVATNSQWTGPIIDIEDFCFGIGHPITKRDHHTIQKIPI
jgi:hypothetical protein